MKIMMSLGMLLFGFVTGILADAGSAFNQTGYPSFTQGIVDTLLGIAAMGVWKLVAVVGKGVREMRQRGDRQEHRLNEHRDELHRTNPTWQERPFEL